jgi:hypothetical protein
MAVQNGFLEGEPRFLKSKCLQLEMPLSEFSFSPTKARFSWQEVLLLQLRRAVVVSKLSPRVRSRNSLG